MRTPQLSTRYVSSQITEHDVITNDVTQELGQVEYIFSDKTGTLTQNIMIFNKCSISGMMYGSITDQSSSQTQDPVNFSSNPYSEPNFRFYDQRLMDAAHDDDDVIDFFRLLAICHTVMPESNPETGSDVIAIIYVITAFHRQVLCCIKHNHQMRALLYQLRETLVSCSNREHTTPSVLLSMVCMTSS